jgi:hypothetical protein
MKTKNIADTNRTVLDGGVDPSARNHEFIVTQYLGRDADGFRVEARGPRGSIETTVAGEVTEQTVVGARFWRS